MTDREKALAYFRNREAQIPMPGARAMYQEAIKALEQPTIEPERKKGKWILHPEIKNVYGGTVVQCSECGEEYVVHYLEDEKYCRNCGAKMEGEKDG